MISPSPQNYSHLPMKDLTGPVTLHSTAMDRSTECAGRKEQMAKRRKSARKPADAPTTDRDSSAPTVTTECTAQRRNPHEVERAIMRELTSQPGVRFSSLVVRRVGNGTVCLEGVLETPDEAPDVSRLVQRVAGVQEVLNHLVVQRPPLVYRLPRPR